jgi:membrane-bound lytic murein transglycosylase A
MGRRHGAAQARWAAPILGLLAACTVLPPPDPAPGPGTAPPTPRVAPAPQAAAAPAAAPAAATAASADAVQPATLQRHRSRWVAARFEELPGWSADRSAELWPALLRGCDRPGADWLQLCAELRLTEPGDDAAMRDWLMQRLQPYRIEALDGNREGLITGYFEPVIAASRTRRGAFQVPLYAPPADLESRKPYWTRRELDTVAAARAALRGREIAFVADPLDALLLQIQGSGRLRLSDGDSRAPTIVRLAYAGHNDQAYVSVGRWLIEQGQMSLDQASWPAIKDWARRHPKRVQEMLWANPRFVFFREESLPDPKLGPRGAAGVPLTPGRSIAVDPQSVPYGTPLWLDTTEPLSARPLQRLVLAQDTGSAIVGAVRADYFWGWDGDAAAQAGRMKQRLRYWALWPKGR